LIQGPPLVSMLLLTGEHLSRCNYGTPFGDDLALFASMDEGR